MPLLPYRKLELHSALTVREVAEILAGAIQPNPGLHLLSGSLPFEGSLKDLTFDIVRTVPVRSTSPGRQLLPWIRGTIGTDPIGSRLSITMGLRVPMLLGLSLLTGGVLAAVVASSYWIPQVFVLFLGLLLPYLFLWIFVIYCFTVEARKAERILGSLIHGTPKRVA